MKQQTNPMPGLSLQVLILGGIVFVAYYSQLGSFGYYEDDWAWAYWAGQPVSDLLGFDPIKSLRGWGRPTGTFLKRAFGWLGSVSGQVWSLYIYGFLIHWVNSALLCIGLQKITGVRLAFVAAALFALFPGDPMKFYLNRTFEGYVAVMFFLLALVLYQNRRWWIRILVYPLALLSLTTYEIVLVYFVALPFLQFRWDRSLVSRVFFHFLGLAIVCLPALAVRFTSRGGRVGELAEKAPLEILERAVSAMGIGVSTSFELLYERIPVGLAGLFPLSAVTSVLIAGTLGVVLWHLLPGARNEDPTHDDFQRWLGSKFASIERMSTTVFATARLGLIGLVLWLTSYAPFILQRYPPDGKIGRGAGIHAGGSIGAVLFLSCLLGLLLYLFANTRANHVAHRVIAVMLAIYLGMLSTFHVLTQKGFVESWADQRQLLADIIQLTPDIDENTLVIIDRKAFRLNKRHDLNLQGWQCAFLYATVYNTGRIPSAGPLCMTYPAVSTRGAPIATEADQIKVHAASWFPKRFFSSGEIIYIERVDGELVRKSGTWDYDGRSYSLKKFDSRQNFPSSVLMDDITQ